MEYLETLMSELENVRSKILKANEQAYDEVEIKAKNLHKQSLDA